MASLCKRQQCTIDRRGFRQELDSWRHKLIHCVGFESILEGLFGEELIEDLKLFKDCEPDAVSDWSFDENCIFCCLRRDKVKEHLINLNNEGLEDTPKPLLVKDQTTLSRLERQAEEFLSAVLRRKDVPNFSDPHVPVVAREILQRMIRQFAAEYTSKTSPSQDSCSDHSDQSLPPSQSLSGAPPSISPAATLAVSAHNQNPVLSKLLMADQEAPLDLTIKKPLAEPTEQDGVLDLSIKKNRNSSNIPVHSPCLSPATSAVKGESTDLRVTKSKDLQSTSTLEQFMAKLCLHHQRQIVDAIGFLQTEVKALASTASPASNPTSGILGTVFPTAKSSAATPDKSCAELSFPSESTSKPEIQDISHSNPSCALKRTPDQAVIPLKTSVPALDLPQTGSGTIQTLVSPTTSPVDIENNRHGDHVPLKMKIMKTSNVMAGNKLSCVLTTSLSSHSNTLEDRQSNSTSSTRTEMHSARLSSSLKRHNQASHPHQVRQRETIGHAKDTPAKLYAFHVSIPSDSPRTARKTIRTSSDLRNRDSTGRGIIDPDLGHCDIVYIDKPITECLKEKHRNMLPRRNARKSTRGHMYAEETWELKTVRTLAGRGNCPNPMPEFITLVTPKQILSKPEGVPPVDMPFAVECREAVNQQTSTEESDERVLPGSGDMVETAVSEADIIVETSQTGQSQSKGQPGPPSPISSPAENIEPDMILEHATPELGKVVENEESVPLTSFNEEEHGKPESEDVTKESDEQVVSETVSKPSGETMSEPLGDNNVEEAEPQLPLEKNDNEPAPQQIGNPSPVHEVEEEMVKNERENVENEQPQEVQVQSETIMNPDNLREIEESNTTESAVEEMVKEQEVKTSETDHSLESVDPEGDDENGCDYDVSTMTMDALSKELLPWRRKKGTVISLPKRMRRAEEVIVGYVNGRPVSASDRSLRRRSSSSISPIKTPEKSSQNVLNKTSVESGVESSNLEKCVPEPNTPVSSPINPPVTEPSSDTPSSPASKVPSRTKHKRAKKQQENTPVLSEESVDSPNTETKRSLRSASQKPETPVMPRTSNISTSSPKPPVSSDLPSTEKVPSLPSSSPPLPVSSPPLVSSSPPPPMPPVIAEESQLSSVQEITVDSNTEKTQQVEKFNEVQKSEIESRVQAKQKLRSGKVITDVSKTEKVQISNDAPLENQSPVKTEVNSQIVPGRVRRVLHKEAEPSNSSVPQKANVATLGDRSVCEDGSKSSTSEKPARMPLRSESSKAEVSQQSLCQSPPVEDRKLALRSQRQAAPSTSSPSAGGRQVDVASPSRMKPERPTKAQPKPSPAPAASVQPHTSAIPVVTPRSEAAKQTANKFYQSLTGEQNQHIITNLNIKYDKMQKGWVQMDKEGQPAPKYKNKADRQAAIWKSKRRTRKPKSSDHQKYSPVQMLFMKGFDLTSICRWFLESTETKSLVIVKKVNTRLPSETQLCFHSSSSTSGTSQGVFPSLQAERLKKHLKKFAIASPVKSNPKSQKLIARALEQEANAVKGKEKKEPSNNASTGLTKSYSSAKTCVLMSESQKTSGKSKNPASARILRKYSNIREKMQVQQANDRLKDKSKTKATKMKTLTTTKAVSKSNLKPSLKPQKSSLRVTKQIKESTTKTEKKKTLAVKKSTKQPVREKAAKTQSNSRPLKDQVKRESPKRVSQRLGSPKTPESNADMSKSKAEKKVETEKAEEEKPTSTKVNAGKVQSKEPPSTVVSNKGIDNAVETPQQCSDVKGSNLPDQVLTRSQRKMEAAMPSSTKPTSGSKRTAKSLATPKAVTRAEEPTVTRSGALKSPPKRSQAASLPRSATKRAQELLETPAKRTRMSK